MEEEQVKGDAGVSDLAPMEMGDDVVDGVEGWREPKKEGTPGDVDSKSSRSEKESRGDSSPRKHKSSSERRHHHNHSGGVSHHHHHHRRRKSSSTPGGVSVEEDGEPSEESSGGKSSRKRSDSTGDHHSDHGGGGNSSSNAKRSSHRRHHEKRSSRRKDRSKRHYDNYYNSDEEEEGQYPGDYNSMGPHGDPWVPRAKGAGAADSHKEPEAEDGEILEDGELGDDDDDGQLDPSATVEDANARASSLDTSREDSQQGSPSKFSGKEETREKREKKADHRDKRKKDGEKRKRKKYSDLDEVDEEEGASSAPAWGSGYQGARPKPGVGLQNSPSYNKQSRRANKGHQSPPGLYDSPSYSEDSDEESMQPSLIPEGYIDASVAADEKEGIFKHGPGMLMKKKKKPMDRERLHGKRGRMDGSKMEGPPKKKALVDIAMADRPVCKFYRDGKCAKGSGCQFNHDVEMSKRYEVCKYHLTAKGCHKERCLYMHEDFPCKYYHTGAQCFAGDRCKFSHDQLTEDSRKALEMRVAAEDIIHPDDPPDYDVDYRSRGYERTRPSLLGSPPRRHDLKKIPSLFEIEVHPPGQSPKPSPQAIRPSGFYSEARLSPKPGSGINAAPNGPGQGSGPPPNSSNNSNAPAGMGNNNNNNNNNPGPMGPSGPQSGPQGGPNQPPMSGPRLLQGQGNVLPGNMNPNMMANSRMPGMQGPQQQQQQQQQQQRPGGGPPMQFMNPAQMNQMGKGPQPVNQMSPVLNMLGAIIREATMQQGGPGGPGNVRGAMPGMGNMGPNSMGNMGPRNMGPNNMGNMGQNNMGNMGPNNIGGPNNMGMNNMGNAMNSMGMNSMSPNAMGNRGPSNMGPNNMGNMGPSSMGNMGPNNMANMGPNNMPPTSVGNSGNVSDPSCAGHDNSLDSTGQKPNSEGGSEEVDDMMDVDYRIKKTLDESEDNNSQDLSELHSIRRQIQEKIAKASQEEEDEEEEEDDDDDEGKMLIAADDDGGLSPERNKATEEANKSPESKTDVEETAAAIEVPAHLPKKQRELFMRIQQQQLLREKEKEKQEAQRAAEEAEAKAEVDDWYSSDEDGDGEKAPKLTDVLKKLNEETAPKASTVSSTPSSTTVSTSSPAPITAASAFNIMQMINRIKSQTPTTSIPSASSSSTLVSSQQQDSNFSVSPASDPRQRKKSLSSPSSSPGQQLSGKSSKNAAEMVFPLQPLSMEPKVVSACPLNPLKYAIVKIALDMPKPYTHLPAGVDPTDYEFRSDPRVKRHLHYMEKQQHALPPKPKENISPRRSSTEEEKPTKPTDPRLKRAAVDPRKTKLAGDNSGNNSSEPNQPADPRLRDKGQNRPIDPRLAKRAAEAAAGGMVDPRLNRQMSQPEMGNQMMNTNVQMVRPMNNPMGMGNMQMGPMVNNLGGPMNMGNQMNNIGMRMKMGGPMNNMGGPVNNMGGPMNSMGVPMNNMGGPMNTMGGGMGNMGGNVNMNPMNMGGPNRLMQGAGPNNMGGVVNRMGGPGMGPMGSRLPGAMMGVRGPSSMGPQMMAGGMNRMAGPGMGGDSPKSDFNASNDPRLNQRNDPKSPDPRLVDPRSNNDPRTGDPRNNDPRSMDPRNNDPRPIDPRNNPRSMDPRANDPRSMDPRSIDPRNSDPRSIDPRNSDPRSMDPRNNDPRSMDLRNNDPRSMDPRNNDPRSMDPRNNDPRSMDPRNNDPRSMDPRNNDPRSMDPRSNDPRSVDPRNNDPRSVDPRNDPRSNDPRFGNQRNQDTKLSDPRQRTKSLDQNMNAGDVSPLSSRQAFDSESVRDPRMSQRDPRREPDSSSAFPDQLAKRSPENFMENLPPLMTSSSLPPLPTLSPPPSSSPNTSSLQPSTMQSVSKDSNSEKEKPARKFDYRNDPRFKRVKRAPGQRKGSMEYSSPLGGEESLPNQEEGGDSSQYNSYTRPKPNAKDPRSLAANIAPSRNTPSPALPDTLHDFPEMSEPEMEPDLKVKDLFKTIDPTASPFC